MADSTRWEPETRSQKPGARNPVRMKKPGFSYSDRISQMLVRPILYEDATNTPFGLSASLPSWATLAGQRSAQPERQIKVVICYSFIQKWYEAIASVSMGAFQFLRSC
ncbi:MAG: hypothetical protein F6J93_29400 [Oscillatoria sp. SIO1A7]|nr:hypothetical protein [Oscillatoria sp. SIO1A7]